MDMEKRWPQMESRQIPETGVNTIKKCRNVCPEAIVIRQYVNEIPRDEIHKWIIKEGLKLKI